MCTKRKKFPALLVFTSGTRLLLCNVFLLSHSERNRFDGCSLLEGVMLLHLFLLQFARGSCTAGFRSSNMVGQVLFLSIFRAPV